MSVHAEYLEMLATAIDFELSDTDAAALNYHLAGCAECRRAGALLRADMAVIASEPAPRLDPVRSRAILRAALRPARPAPPWRLLAVAAVLATIGGGVLVAGRSQIDQPEESSAIVAPSSSPGAIVAASDQPGEGSTDRPNAPATPRATRVPGTAVPADRPPKTGLPVAGDAAGVGTLVQVAPLADGSAYVTIPDGPDTVLVLLDPDGQPRRGWPIRLDEADFCTLGTVDRDESARLVCHLGPPPDTCSDVCGEARAYAFDTRGRALAGWPLAFALTVDSGVDISSAVVVGDRLLIVSADFEGTDEEEEEGDSAGQAWLIEIGANGAIRTGVSVPRPIFCCVVSPDGVAYGWSHQSVDEEWVSAHLTAFGLNGVLPGWPQMTDPILSQVGFDPDGRVYVLTRSASDDGVHVIVFNPGEPTFPTEFPSIGPGDAWDDAWPPPVVASDRTVFVIDGEQVVAMAPSGEIVDGWPYEPTTDLATIEDACPPGDTGCPFYIVPPALGSGNVLYVVERAPDDSSGARITAVNPSGKVRKGWPVGLRRAGAEFVSVVVGPDGSAFAVAVEPEANGRWSATVLRIARDSTVLAVTTLVDP